MNHRLTKLRQFLYHILDMMIICMEWKIEKSDWVSRLVCARSKLGGSNPYRFEKLQMKTNKLPARSQLKGHKIYKKLKHIQVTAVLGIRVQ
jgi:hypothetical protein